MKFVKVVLPLVLLTAAAIGIAFFVPSGPADDVANVQAQQVNVQLVVEDAVYSYTVREGSTAHSLMQTIAAREEAFSFAGTDSPFGFFIDSINGRENDVERQDYWTLYVNGEMAQAGVLNIYLSEGDVITWKYEHVEL